MIKMKQAILSLFILCISLTAYAQNETAIYKKVVEDYILKYKQPNTGSASVTFIVLDAPRYMNKLDSSDFSRFKGQYDKLEESTFINFVENNQKGLYRKGLITLDGIEIIIVDREQSEKRQELLSKYPMWNRSILEFSNIGFADEKKQALVYYGFDSGPGVGGGVYLIFEKKRGKWHNKAAFPAWTT